MSILDLGTTGTIPPRFYHDVYVCPDPSFFENCLIREEQKKKKKRKKAAKSTLSFSMDDEGGEDDSPSNGKDKEKSEDNEDTRTFDCVI